MFTRSLIRGSRGGLIESPLFCNQQCLLELAYTGSTDENCPNSNHRGQRHINRLEFLYLFRHQLATDHRHNAVRAPLHLSGSRGSLLKVRLSIHGYAPIAKGVENLNLTFLHHENEIYDRLQAIQGKHIPMSLRSIELVRPYYEDSGVCMHFMFLTWAEQPLFNCDGQAVKVGIVDPVITMYRAVHKIYVLHHDADSRNILYNTSNGNSMVVDFERAGVRGCQPLSPVGSNG